MSVFEITVQRKEEDAWPVVVRHQPGAQDLAQWSRGRLELEPERVSVKFKTAEKVGPVGEGHSAEAQAVATLAR